MLNLLIFLLVPDGVVVMAIDDRVKNASFWLGIGEFLVRCILWCILYFMVVVAFGGIRCRATTPCGMRCRVTVYWIGGMRCRPTFFYMGLEVSLMPVVAESPAPLMVASASFMEDSKSCSTIFTSC